MSGQTLRQIVRTSIGGHVAIVDLSLPRRGVGPASTPVLVTLGDSITDGYQSDP